MSAETVPSSWAGTDNDAVTDFPERVPGRYRKSGGYTVDEFFALSDLPPHTELIDGELVFVSPQRLFHLRLVRLLEFGLLRFVPADLEVVREMNVVIGRQQAPEPDLFLVRVEVLSGGDDTRYPAEAVLLAVEVESPESRERDRLRKPRLYAEGGIQHYWRVERQDGQAVVHVHELDPVTSTYRLTGVHHGRLKVTEPFDLDIDLSDPDRAGRPDLT